MYFISPGRLAGKQFQPIPTSCYLPNVADGCTHILPGCQHPNIQKMVTERNNAAGRRILKAIENGAHCAGLFSTDVRGKLRTHIRGWLAENTEMLNRRFPPWLLPPKVQQIRNIRSRPDAILVRPKDLGQHCSRDIRLPLRGSSVSLQLNADLTPNAKSSYKKHSASTQN